MTVVEASIDIQAPIRPVFEAVTDPRRASEWNPHIVHADDVEWPIGVGSTWHQTAIMAGRTLNVTCQVTEFQPPSYGAMEVSGDQRARMWTRCEEAGEATHVIQGIDFEPPRRPFGMLAGRLLHAMVHRELSATLKRQRDVLERENGGIGGSRT